MEVADTAHSLSGQVNSVTISDVDFTYNDDIAMIKTIFDALGDDVKTIKFEEVNIYKFASYNECIEKLKNLEAMEFSKCSAKNFGESRLVRIPTLSSVHFKNSNADLLKMFEDHDSIRDLIFVADNPSIIYGNAKLEELRPTLPNLNHNWGKNDTL